MIIIALPGCGAEPCAGACSAADAEVPADASSEVSADTETSTETDAAPLDLDPPVILDLALVPVGGNPLAVALTFGTDEPVTWTLVVDEVGTGRSWDLTADLAPATTHLVPVLRLRADRSYHFTLEVVDGAANATVDESLTWDTGPLPDDFPRFTLLESPPEDMAQGMTLLNLILWGSGVLDQGILVVVDDEGEVVWYHRATETLVEARRTAAGTLVVAFGESDGIREIDMLGNVLHEWRPADLGLDGLHHAVAPGPDGSLLSLAPELRWVDGYTRGDGSTTGYSVVGDVVVELPREGLPVRAWSLLDVLDPYHYNPGFLTPFWFLLYPDAAGGAKDWSHGNAVQYDPDDDSYVVSLANQDMIVKLDRGTGKPVWSLGEGGDVALADGGGWFSVPHGAEWSAEGRVLLYDDGVFKAERRSRVVEYAMSAPQGGGPWEAEEIWSWDGGGVPFYCMGPADVDVLPDDMVLILHGSLVEHPEASPFGSDNRLWIRLEIVRREPVGERVFGLDIGGPLDPKVKKITSFAAERLTGLYPPGWVVHPREPPPPPSCEEVCAGAECGWISGCICGICFPGLICLEGQCVDCDETCASQDRVCGLLDLSCDCGACPQGFLCDEAGACMDEAALCAPFCEDRECGVVGAFYLGQSCDCGTCPEDQTCDPQTAKCL
ncbi:MAG: aryl-sulfate sulfotransferase [Pseudomonadota bacterium]